MRFGRLFVRLCAAARVLPVLACALFLAGCEVRVGKQVSLFDDEAAIAKAMSAIESRFKEPIRALKVTLNDNELVVQAKDPRGLSQISEWRLVRERFTYVSFDRLSGPHLVESAINPGIDAKLFDLKEVNLADWGKVADAAIARAALEDKSGVSSIEVARMSVLLPGTPSGAVRWSIEVTSTRESARIFANAKGEITGANLNGTLRMRNLNMYQRPELAADAAAEVRDQVGDKPILIKVAFDSASISFATNLKDDSYPIAGIRANAVYNWSYNGLQRTTGSAAFGSGFSNPDAPFGMGEVDWTLLPKIVADAQAKLAMPGGRITAIDLTKPTSGVGAPAPLWKITIEENRERGTYTADAKGAMKSFLPPPSKRKPTNWLAPESVAQTLTRIAEEFGADTRIVNILINDSGATIVAEDPRKPGQPMQALLREEGFSRWGTPMMMFEGRPFTMRDLKDLTAQRIAALSERTLKELNMPPGSVVRFTFGRGALQASRKGTVTAEIRAETPRQGHGRAVLELDGAVVEVIRP